MTTKGLSNPATTRVVRALLDGLDWRRARVADVGAGRGHFCAVVGEWLRREKQLDPAEHLFPCDLFPESFQFDGLTCARTRPDGTLPFADETFDAAISIEVVEHVEDPFRFLRELARIVRPGGRVIVTTPNVLSLTSRLRNLLWGFPELFDPLPLTAADVRFLSGHIHPIAPYYLALAALRAGLESPSFHADRKKRSASFWTIALSPALVGARLFQTARLRKKQPAVLEQNRAMLDDLNRFPMLTSRTAILLAHKPGAVAPAHEARG